MSMDSAIKKAVNGLPAFPATVHRVTALINDPDSSMAELVDVVRLDQSITANILRMCNSAYFGLRHKVDNVQDAILYLGRQNIVRAVMAAGASRFFRNTPGYEAEAKVMWEHAVGTALLAQILSKKVTGREETSLFTAAILHDIGKIVLGAFVKDKYAEIKKIVSGESRSFLEAEEKVLGMNHATLGGLIAANWNNAQDIVPIVLGHLETGGMALLGFVANLFLIPMVMFYLLQEWPRILNDIDSVMSEFLRGQLSVMMLLAVFYSVGLWFAGLNFALPVGVLTGLLVFIPYVGFGGGLILAILAALLQAEGWPPLVGVAVVYGLGQLVESFLLTPYLVGERIGLHPLAVIFALMAFGQLFGFVGVLVALPVGAALLVGLREVRQAWLASPVYLGTQPRPVIARELERP